MLITKQKELDKLCAALAKHDFITIDTEFLREKTYYPKLCLIQVSAPDKKAAAIDPLEGNLDLAPLFELLHNENVLKVFHAARQDLEIFFNLTGKVVHPFFDTQIAAMVLGHGDQVGYEALVRNITGGQIDKSAQFTNWSYRPLSDKQLNYALGMSPIFVMYINISPKSLSAATVHHGSTRKRLFWKIRQHTRIIMMKLGNGLKSALPNREALPFYAPSPPGENNVHKKKIFPNLG